MEGSYFMPVSNEFVALLSTVKHDLVVDVRPSMCVAVAGGRNANLVGCQFGKMLGT